MCMQAACLSCAALQVGNVIIGNIANIQVQSNLFLHFHQQQD